MYCTAREYEFNEQGEFECGLYLYYTTKCFMISGNVGSVKLGHLTMGKVEGAMTHVCGTRMWFEDVRGDHEAASSAW